MGSVTGKTKASSGAPEISTHTLRGERDYSDSLNIDLSLKISTHTLRGERDNVTYDPFSNIGPFQLTRSVGSVTLYPLLLDVREYHFNSHAPWGA